jgi:5,5'-dehydrodivanillate O-demethylase oxygenase subunit
MLRSDLNDRLTQVGPGTPMGDLYRRYWLPIATQTDIADNPVKRVRILGENLVLFATADGSLGLVAERCPHRGASLGYGFPDGNGLRCPYHGWLFSPEGKCLEQPNQTPDSPSLKERSAIAGYPVQALGGLVFAYMGPTPVPPLPRFDLYTWQEGNGRFRDIGSAIIPCNWLQIMENSIDQVHYEWLHLRFTAFARRMAGREVEAKPPSHSMKFRYRDTAYGFLKEYSVDPDDEVTRWMINGPIAFPNIVVTGPAGMPCFQMRVPVDDVTTRMYFYTSYKLSPAQKDRLRGVLAADVLDGQRVPFIRRDPPRVDTVDYVALDNNGTQDLLVVMSQGRLYDRATENPGRSDVGLTMFRNLLWRELEKIGRGEDAMNVFRDPNENERLDLPNPNMGELHRMKLFPRTGGRPAGNVQAFSPFLTKMREVGIDPCELLLEPSRREAGAS